MTNQHFPWSMTKRGKVNLWVVSKECLVRGIQVAQVVLVRLCFVDQKCVK